VAAEGGGTLGEIAELLWSKDGHLHAPFPRPAGGARGTRILLRRDPRLRGRLRLALPSRTRLHLSTYLGKDASTVKTAADLFAHHTVHYRLDRVKELTLEVSGWEGHKAGQHVDVRLTAPDGYQAQRSYSIASAPEDQRLVLTVDRLDDGEVSPYLTDVLEVGDRLELRGPIGGYFTWAAEDGGPLLLVAGGSGVVPLMAMLRHRAAVGSDVPARLLYSSRSYEEIIYRKELADLAAQDGSLEVIHTLTRSRPEGWSGYDRRIDAQMLAEVTWFPDESPLAFVCGPTPFVEAVGVALVGLEHEPARVKTERFGTTGG
jgi:ferredoxin-NADP reductase